MLSRLGVDLELFSRWKEMERRWSWNSILDEDEILRLSKQVGPEWRQFGNALKFNFTKLDALAAETQTQSDAVHKMVLDWMAWKKEKATVGRLTKALYLNTEWEAILSLNPW